MSKITKIKAREILDSRGNPTIEVDVTTENTSAVAAVPSGASTGKHEALELRDGTKRYGGKGVLKAVRNVNRKISVLLKGMNCSEQKKIDELMIKKDNTDNKGRFGANALLGVSLACARATALEKRKHLFEYLHELSGVDKKISLPRPFFNVINGGKHAGNRLPFQEFMIAPKAKTFSEALRMGSEVYHALKGVIEKKYGKEATNVGDEGGFAPPVKKAEEALDLLKTAVKKAGYSGKVEFAMDCAASEFYKEGYYHLHKKMNKKSLLEYYLHLIKRYPLFSIEDPFEQEDFLSFAELRKKSKIQIVGDDLTVTNIERIEEAVKEKSCNCLLLKVNQIGTLSEALDAVKLAYRNGWKVMVSHRSGETEDTFIADLAVGIGCGMIKAGAPCRGERISKYNRLLRIEEFWNDNNNGFKNNKA
ncbi:MAG: phosphopyruvate hydratase [Nanoarchaeota archaeon]|nr:phosphopyruvate hydratase [Nanoarchaeota archaeon]MBU1644142.1 phosphopyruvate hydratase [Nanoarchaeota archaeon]MBU1976660.1 phosphopyruvate hydratase [Nanoarchaeota archaeon]